MDIQKWLAEIESPVRPEHLDIEPFLVPRHHHTTIGSRRRRKRSSSDSSLLTASYPRPRRSDTAVIQGVSHFAHRSVEDLDSDAPRHVQRRSVASSAANERYARKSRHKVRPDKYVAESRRSKEQARDLHPSRRTAPKKTKRRSTRRRDERTYNGLGREYQPANVSNHRLTVSMVDTRLHTES